MGIEELLIAPRSPWKNPYVERLIAGISREALDHMIVLRERHLTRVLQSYFDYCHTYRTHRALDMDALLMRPVHTPDQCHQRQRVRA
jgi:putative transposase